MASSGTYAFAPEVVDVIDEAFERAGVDPAKLGERHLRSARMSINLLNVDWANDGVSLYMVSEQTQTLTDGDPTYTAPTGTIAILECVVRRSGVDTPVHRISREQYHLIPNKTQEGLPSQIYLDRATGIYTLWNTPENSTDVLRFYALRRRQDVGVNLGQTPDTNYLWLEALCAGLAAKLALKFNAARFALLEGLADKAFKKAKDEDRERGPVEFVAGV